MNNQADQNLNEIWNGLQLALKESAEEVLGFKTRNKKDWFDQNSAEIQELLAKKNQAHDAWLSNLNSDTLKTGFQNFRKEAQSKLREMVA